MTGKKLETQLADFYWELDEAVDILRCSSKLDTDDVVAISAIQSHLHSILRGASKKWATEYKNTPPTKHLA